MPKYVGRPRLFKRSGRVAYDQKTKGPYAQGSGSRTLDTNAVTCDLLLIGCTLCIYIGQMASIYQDDFLTAFLGTCAILEWPFSDSQTCATDDSTVAWVLYTHLL